MRTFLLSAISVLASCLLLATVASHGTPDLAPHHNVEMIDTSNYDAVVGSDDRAWVLEFHSPRCGTCIEMEPIWEALVHHEDFADSIRFGRVDIDDAQGTYESHPSPVQRIARVGVGCSSVQCSPVRVRCAGMELARVLGVLEEGIPNVQLWRSATLPSSRERVWTGYDVPSASELQKLLHDALVGVKKNAKGHYVKSSEMIVD